MSRFWMTIIKTLVITEIMCLPVQAGVFSQGPCFEFGASYTAISPDDVNEYLDRVNAFLEENKYDHISGICGVYGGIRQKIGLGVSVVARIGYLKGSTNKEQITYWDETGVKRGTVEGEYKLSTIPIAVGSGYGFKKKAVVIGVEIIGELHILKFKYVTSENAAAGIPEFSIGWNGTAFGLNSAIVAEWTPTKQLILGGRTGYRVTEKSELTSDQEFAPPIIADISGFYLSLYVGVAPWN